MDNTLENVWNGDKAMKDEEKYYYAAGIRFEKDRKYTVEDYDALPEWVRVELINGVFYDLYPDENAEYPPKNYVVYPDIADSDHDTIKMTGPGTRHQRIVTRMCQWIGNYIEEKGGDCEVFPAPFAVRLNKDDKTSVEPDVSVICDPDRISERGCEGAPDWIIEIISPGNPSNDYIRKLNLYLDAGVREYWIVDPIKDQITVFNFEDTGSSPTYYNFKDKVKAGIYEDLYIDFSKI